MRDRMERFVLLPFSAGCISESSIPVVVQHPRRSKPDTNSAPPTRTNEYRKVLDEEEYLYDEESLSSGENLKTVVPRFQKLFKNFKNLSQLFAYKVELEPEIVMEIGVPTDVKHVTHIGLDSCATSIFSKNWDDLDESDLINLHSFPFSQPDATNISTLIQTKCKLHNDSITP